MSAQSMNEQLFAAFVSTNCHEVIDDLNSCLPPLRTTSPRAAEIATEKLLEIFQLKSGVGDLAPIREEAGAESWDLLWRTAGEAVVEVWQEELAAMSGYTLVGVRTVDNADAALH